MLLFLFRVYVKILIEKIPLYNFVQLAFEVYRHSSNYLIIMCAKTCLYTQFITSVKLKKMYEIPFVSCTKSARKSR